MNVCQSVNSGTEILMDLLLKRAGVVSSLEIFPNYSFWEFEMELKSGSTLFCIRPQLISPVHCTQKCNAHKSATHRAVQWQNVKCSTAVKHTKEAMLPTKQFFLYCVVVPIWISTFTFHGLLNFCAHAFLKLWLVLQISTLKASILLDFLVWTKRSFETRPVI